MPDNLDEPAHRIMREVAADGPRAAKLGGAGRTMRFGAGWYFSPLRPLAARGDVWRTVYHHQLEGGADAVRLLPDVVECHLMAGDCDFLLRVVVADLEEYRRFQAEHLTRIPGVQSVKTEIPTQKIKLTSEIPM
ncbi:Lrp/AsnC ligand binding domain-containing protein [Burkholderia gladioli]|nr:Lrp/AsnC ligand binding domain-containing protein [Burkholderia gladioli]